MGGRDKGLLLVPVPLPPPAPPASAPALLRLRLPTRLLLLLLSLLLLLPSLALALALALGLPPGNIFGPELLAFQNFGILDLTKLSTKAADFLSACRQPIQAPAHASLSRRPWMQRVATVATELQKLVVLERAVRTRFPCSGPRG